MGNDVSWHLEGNCVKLGSHLDQHTSMLGITEASSVGARGPVPFSSGPSRPMSFPFSHFFAFTLTVSPCAAVGEPTEDVPGLSLPGAGGEGFPCSRLRGRRGRPCGTQEQGVS